MSEDLFRVVQTNWKEFERLTNTNASEFRNFAKLPVSVIRNLSISDPCLSLAHNVLLQCLSELCFASKIQVSNKNLAGQLFQSNNGLASRRRIRRKMAAEEGNEIYGL